MSKKPIYIGTNPLKTNKQDIKGDYTLINGEKYFKISNYDNMPPFFMSIVSNSDHWMFLSSYGGLTAGRIDADNALFPYYTDDKIHDSQDLTGSKTIVFIESDDKRQLWEPFSQKFIGLYQIERNIYKNIPGNKVVFEEINKDLNITFQYAWNNSEKFGIIKKSKLINNSAVAVHVEFVDGIQNILPYGVDSAVQSRFSTLLDAYKKNELLAESKVGVFMLSSIPADKAEPNEALKATTVWSTGLDDYKILLSSLQLDKFRDGQNIKQEVDIRAARGAFFVHAEIDLVKELEWYITAEINQDAADVAALENFVKATPNAQKNVQQDIDLGTENLIKIVANADGLQESSDEKITARHFANVLFNVMRGGIFDNSYEIDKLDFIQFVQQANKTMAKKYSDFFDQIPDKIQYAQLKKEIESTNDVSLKRLFLDYLPLTFSRRHGDPSRPWNQFAIKTKNEHGEKILNYQGNWRDIFQNWEALAISFPEYIESFISKFVNSTSADGYNPYRVTRDGCEWETLDPDDPWSNIGYWGDHQIIYLLKLLELGQKYHPNLLNDLLVTEKFSFINIPYRIKGYEEIVKDPQNTIEFDNELDKAISSRVDEMGGDGKLLANSVGEITYSNLTEKLLIPVLAKLTNYIPQAGIWMNTLRPEWNDANNALVGNGVSMVTLYYIRRYLAFCKELFSSSPHSSIQLSSQVSELLASITSTFETHQSDLANPISDQRRKSIMDKLGSAGTVYRNDIYKNGLTNSSTVDKNDLVKFCQITLDHIDHSIKNNKRQDGLYHAYNLIKIEGESATIRYLYEMLEGQVAVLSAGVMTPREVLELLNKLKNSAMFRHDQYSYTLYPDRQLARFVEKNNISKEEVKRSALLKQLIDDGHKDIIIQDVNGNYHFNGEFHNNNDLVAALKKLELSNYSQLVKDEKELVLDIFENVFDHQSFTGRSGTFYGYEGLGSIYWHMVSKLLIAVQENIYKAWELKTDPKIIGKLVDHYYEIRAGIGAHKSPELYGAFPTDPYSHTPGNAGAQQPGMTGQVKEDILARFGECGVVVNNGCLSIKPELLNKDEFLSKSTIFEYFDVNGQKQIIDLSENSFGFTYCQVPIIYHLSNEPKLIISKNEFQTEQIELELSADSSSSIFARENNITRIDVFFSK